MRRPSNDPVGRLATLTEAMSGTAGDQSASFTYNPASQIVAVTRANDAFAWTGHGSGTTPSVANGLNQLSFIAGAATARDAKGKLTGDPTTGKSYAYSSENLLTGSTGGAAANYGDNSLNTRIAPPSPLGDGFCFSGYFVPASLPAAQAPRPAQQSR